MTPEPADRFEFSPELDRDLLALARDLEIRAEEFPEPAAAASFERERRRLEDLIRRQLPKGRRREEA